jgi:glycerol-3-phosphate acyltransferase PlsX
MKSHGSADVTAFAHALARAYDAASNQVVDRISAKLAELQVQQTAPNELQEESE